MSECSYWIQRADLSVTEGGPVDVQAGVALARQHDWAGEWRLMEEREAAGEDFCPAGIAFTNEAGHRLHLCPDPDGTIALSYEYTETGRWLGVFSSSRPIARRVQASGWVQVEEYIRRLFAGDHDWLVQQTLP